MTRGEMLPLQHAAQALGVADEEIRRLASQGSIPGAVDRAGDWLIPMMSLVSLAKQKGWTLDLATLQQQLEDPALARYSGDALAAHAAVLLAKTQATAARVESRDLLRRLRETADAAAADRQARLDAANTIAQLERSLEEARRDHAVAEAKAAELRNRQSIDNEQVRFMVERIRSLEQERELLDRCLGWLGRLRYRHLVERQHPTAQPAEVVRGDGRSIEPDASTDDRLDPTVNPDLADDATELVELPDLDLPVWDLATADGSVAPDRQQWLAPPAPRLPTHVPMPIPPVSISSASTIATGDVGQQPSVDDEGTGPLPSPTLPRTADGRFGRSTLHVVG